MIRSELVNKIASKIGVLPLKDIDSAVKLIVHCLSASMMQAQRVEIRGFGSFCLHHRKPRKGRNPKTGVSLILPARDLPYFKPGKELREKINHDRHH